MKKMSFGSMYESGQLMPMVFAPVFVRPPLRGRWRVDVLKISSNAGSSLRCQGVHLLNVPGAGDRLLAETHAELLREFAERKDDTFTKNLLGGDIPAQGSFFLEGADALIGTTCVLVVLFQNLAAHPIFVPNVHVDCTQVE